MAADETIKDAKNICILAIKDGISADDYRALTEYFNQAQFTLLAPDFAFEDLDQAAAPDLWHDGARSGFLKVLTISRRMSWSSFDLVINWQGGGIEKALCFMLLPKPIIMNKNQLLTQIDC